MTGCMRLGRVGSASADSSLGKPGTASAAPQELVYLNRVIRAVPETQSMEIEADQRHVTNDSPWCCASLAWTPAIARVRT
eukprot:154788-Amphidinium_carterae.2